MRVRIGDLPPGASFLQQLRHAELSAMTGEEIADKLRQLANNGWERSALKWHFERHRRQVGADTAEEYAELARQVVGSYTHVFSEIYIDPQAVQQYGLGWMLPWEREEKIKEVEEQLPRSWIFVDEQTGRVAVVSDKGTFMTLYAHTVPQGIAAFIEHRLATEAVRIIVEVSPANTRSTSYG